MATTNKILAIAVSTGRAGYVYIVGGTLKDWQISRKATNSMIDLTVWAQRAINELRPDVVVTEKITSRCRKSRKSKQLISTVTQLASHNYVMDVSVERPHTSLTKYELAAEQIQRYPELRGWLPRRRFFDPEPRNTILFEALSLAEVVRERHICSLAAVR